MGPKRDGLVFDLTQARQVTIPTSRGSGCAVSRALTQNERDGQAERAGANQLPPPYHGLALLKHGLKVTS